MKTSDMAAGIEPTAAQSGESTPSVQKRAKSSQNQTLTASDTPPSTSPKSKSMQKQCTSDTLSDPPTLYGTIYEEAVPEDLAQVIAAWDKLPAKVKNKVLKLVQAAHQRHVR